MFNLKEKTNMNPIQARNVCHWCRKNCSINVFEKSLVLMVVERFESSIDLNDFSTKIQINVKFAMTNCPYKLFFLQCAWYLCSIDFIYVPIDDAKKITVIEWYSKSTQNLWPHSLYSSLGYYILARHFLLLIEFLCSLLTFLHCFFALFALSLKLRRDAELFLHVNVTNILDSVLNYRKTHFQNKLLDRASLKIVFHY